MKQNGIHPEIKESIERLVSYVLKETESDHNSANGFDRINHIYRHAETVQEWLQGYCGRRPRFALGTIVIAPVVAGFVNRLDLFQGIELHNSGSWDICNCSDPHENELAINADRPIHTWCEDRNNVGFSIATNADRTITTISN